MKVMVWFFVTDIHKVMTTPFLLCLSSLAGSDRMSTIKVLLWSFICNHIDIFLVQMQLRCIRFACGEGNFCYCWPWIASICTWPPIWLAKLPCSGLAQLHQVIFSRIQLIMWVSDSEVFSFFYRDFKPSASEKSCSTLCRGHCIMFGWRPLSCEHLLPCNTLNSSKPGRPTSCAPYYPHM
jgi:hypothetical protein